MRKVKYTGTIEAINSATFTDQTLEELGNLFTEKFTQEEYNMNP